MIKYSVAEVFDQDIQTDVILSLTAAILFITVLRNGSSNVQGELAYGEKLLSEAHEQPQAAAHALSPHSSLQGLSL